MKVYMPILATPESPHRERARTDAGDVVRKLSEMADDAAAVLPTELFIEISRLANLAADFLVQYDEGQDTSQLLQTFYGQGAKTALMTRALLGIDELSQESLNLFATHGNLERLSKIEAHELIKRVQSKQENES